MDNPADDQEPNWRNPFLPMSQVMGSAYGSGADAGETARDTPRREAQPEAITWKVPGWAILAGRPKVVHRPHPERLGYAMCGLRLGPAAKVVRRRPGSNCQLCVTCGRIRADTLAGAGDDRALPSAYRPRRKFDPVPGPIADKPVGSWRSPWWVLLAGDQDWMHRLHPERAAQTLCALPVTTAATGYYRRPPELRLCQPCADELSRVRAPRGGARVTDPDEVDRLDRARARGTSIRPLRGGLPTLGRRR